MTFDHEAIVRERELGMRKLAVYQQGFEGKFGAVHRPPEIDTQVLCIGLEALKGPSKPQDPEILSTKTVPFVVVTSGYDENGDPILHPTAEASIGAWVDAVRYLSPQKSHALYWRTFPVLSHEVDFTTDKQGWKVYSRFGIDLTANV